MDKVSEKEAKKVIKAYKKELLKTKKNMKQILSLAILENNSITEYKEYETEAIISDINSELDRLFQMEEEKLNKALIEHYNRIYDLGISNLKLNSNFGYISSDKALKAIAYKWSGLSFSERIWKRRNILASTVKEIIRQGFIRGDSIQDMSRLLADKLNANYKAAERLIHTETRFIQTTATADTFREAKLTKYEYMAYLDSRTSEACRELDGQIFKLDEMVVGKNAPPMHPRCRSAIAPVVD